jgi:hypothetical protein
MLLKDPFASGLLKKGQVQGGTIHPPDGYPEAG